MQGLKWRGRPDPGRARSDRYSFERFRLPLCCLALPRIPGPFSLDRDKPEVTRHRARGGHSIDCARFVAVSTRYADTQCLYLHFERIA